MKKNMHLGGMGLSWGMIGWMGWLVILCPHVSVAASSGGSPRLLAAGIVFPSLHDAVSNNAATLPGAEELMVSARATYEPPLNGYDGHGYSGSLAMSAPKVGLGVTFGGASNIYSGSQHVLSLGAGYRISGLGIGLTYSSAFGAYVGGGSLSVGAIFGKPSKTSFGLVLNGLTYSAPQLSLGVGYMDPDEGRYFLEADLQLPSFSSGLASTGSTYIPSLHAGLNVGRFGLGFGTALSYTIGYAFSFSPTFNIEGVFSITKQLAFSLRYESGNQVQLGLTWKF